MLYLERHSFILFIGFSHHCVVGDPELVYFQEITDESRDDLVITHTTANGSYAVYIVKLNVVSASLKA